MSDIQEEQKRLYKRAEENDIKLLQEELEYQKQAENEYNEKHLKLMNMYSDLKSRNEKAIEYIKKLDSETTDMYEICETCKNKLLDILNELGGKNE